MLEHLIAKFDKKLNKTESLEEHADAVLSIWDELYERYHPFLDVDDTFWFDSFVAALFHDLGKATYNFQENIILIKNGKSINKNTHIRHELISGIFLVFKNIYDNKHPLFKNKAQIFAVFTHHKNFEQQMFNQDTFVKKWEFKNEDYNLYIDFAKKRLLKRFPTNSLFFEYTNKVKSKLDKSSIKGIIDFIWGSGLSSGIFNENLANIDYNYRKDYIFQKAILNIADWTGSSENRKLPQLLTFNTENLLDKVNAKLLHENKPAIIHFREFQLKSIQNINIISIAPTGSGKTEASLLWASQRIGFEKIIYLLPTRVTANALYKRFHGYFEIEKNGSDFTAVVHSSAVMFRQDTDKHYDNFKYLTDRTFFKALTVGTVDQLLTQGFNLGRWEIKTFHLFRAKVIIDEIHVYAPYTLGLLIASILYLRKYFHTQFYIMTATMPAQLKALLIESLGNEVDIIEETTLLNEKRNNFRTTKKSIDELKPTITKSLKKGKKVLIVVNTVDEAIRIYDEYSSFERLCYHSKFTIKDRLDKENQILENEINNKGNFSLLIATQVVEVSLDIDYDIIITENAPIDAIIQRAGRVNRNRKKTDTEVIVFPHREVTAKYVYKNAPKNTLEKTFDLLPKGKGKKLSEKDLLDLVDEVYKDWNIKNDSSYIEALGKYERILKETYSYIMDNNSKDNESYTREGMDSIDVILDDVIEIAENETGLSWHEIPLKDKIKYQVGIRNWQYKERKMPDKRDKLLYANIYYTSEKGVQFKKKKYSLSL